MLFNGDVNRVHGEEFIYDCFMPDLTVYVSDGCLCLVIRVDVALT